MAGNLVRKGLQTKERKRNPLSIGTIDDRI